MLPEGWTGPFAVDFSDTVEGTYNVEVQCTNYYWEGPSWTYDGNTNYHTWTIPPLHDDHYVDSTDSCVFRVFNPYYYNGWASAYVDVTPNPLQLCAASASPSTFYPIVPDGYEDTTKISYRMSRDATVTASVLDATGAAVRSETLGALEGGNRYYLWDGTDNSGVAVPPGSYLVLLTGRASDGTSSTVQVPVTVATGYVTRSYQASKAGRNSTVSGSRPCGWDTYYRTRRIACYGGKVHATARWTFAIPAAGYGVTWSMSGSRPPWDRPSRGTITKSGARSSATSYVLRATVTRHRAYDIDAVRIAWKRKVRI